MILDKIVEKKIVFLEEQKKKISEDEMKSMALSIKEKPTNTTFYSNLKKDGLSIIGEFKNASPSAGDFDSKVDLASRIDFYSKSVDAISCLTEVDYFKGSIEYLKQIKQLTSLPILRKDFMIDEYQFYEAKIIGASAVLLICAILDDYQIKYFYKLARSLDLDVLVEVHNENEMERALKINPRIIGVNNRNLNDFSINLDTTRRLRKMVDDEKIFVSESGIYTPGDISYLSDVKIDAVLVGQMLMESFNPEETANTIKNIYNERRVVAYEN
ncbi:indole-3-glycerol phosphate synthase TrpC [Lachnobacterium bovis]|uniref:Indole-3-glycerol phosphate synthase n=1 Tax=Lachnobacterium bovis DSM 14045 TaxID=1122142 RepID=A0A1H3H189_9FIRM|nr:indole-3-glycerol phosphate synthase TrpC [Lachnobacterium bovis]SDY08524.1 indole-3-glycerol phosphate synthase [Lachnobacterium bovis DSM 14045]